MLGKEPNNEYDPDAIAVHTLSGQSLGYVPRDFNNKFPHDTNFARVQSVGASANEEVPLLGAIVSSAISSTQFAVHANVVFTCLQMRLRLQKAGRQMASNLLSAQVKLACLLDVASISQTAVIGDLPMASKA